jgi:hypothetical protein
LEHADGKRLEHQRESRMLASPGDSDGFNAAFFAATAGNRGTNLGGELHRVEVSPSSFRCSVCPRTFRFAFGANKAAASVRKLNDDSTGYQIQVDVFDVPVVTKPEKLSVV